MTSTTQDREDKPSLEKFCRVCINLTTHKYIGTQEYNGKAIYDLYNCVRCNNTIASNLRSTLPEPEDNLHESEHDERW